MVVVKLAAMTCVFYLGSAVLMEALLVLLAHVLGTAGFSLSRSGWMVLFGMVWLASFLLAWRVVIPPILARIPK